MKASKKATPGLPASSRMQMPSGGAKSIGKMTKETSGMKGGTKGSTKMSGSKGKGMTKKGGY
jgi:hypothetical protein